MRLFNVGMTRNRKGTNFLSAGQTWKILEHLVAELVRLNSARGIETIFALLPAEMEVFENDMDHRRMRLKRTMSIEGAHYVDLTEVMRLEEDPEGLFIQPGDLPYSFAAGHYNARGNMLVADHLRQTIESVRKLVPQ